MPEPFKVEVSRLKWPVYLATRLQIAQAGGTGINEVPSNAIKVHADIQAVGALTFWGGTQVDAPITHRIFIRWIEAVDNTSTVIRQTLRRNGSLRTERFRVRRWRELGGRKVYAMLEVELEQYES